MNKTRDYMFTSKNIEICLANVRDKSNTCAKDTTMVAQSISNNSEHHSKTSTSMLYIPSKKDTLFWCLYIMKYGKNTYDLLSEHTFSAEKAEKIKLVELMRQHKVYIKAQKLCSKKIEEELVYHTHISPTTFLCLCAIQKIPVVIVQNQRYCYSIPDKSPLHLIEYKDHRWGMYMMEKIHDKELYYQENYWHIDKWSKPLKAVSTYKVADLRDICKKVGLPIIHNLDNGKQKWIKKADLYLSIKQYL